MDCYTTIKGLQVGDTAPLLFPLIQTSYAHPNTAFTPPVDTLLYIDIWFGETKKIDRGAVTIAESFARYVPAADVFDEEGEYTIQVYGVIGATETSPARQYASPKMTHQRRANMADLVFT